MLKLRLTVQTLFFVTLLPSLIQSASGSEPKHVDATFLFSTTKLKWYQPNSATSADLVAVTQAQAKATCDRLKLALPTKQDLLELRIKCGGSAQSHEGYSKCFPMRAPSSSKISAIWSDTRHPTFGNLAFYMSVHSGFIYADEAEMFVPEVFTVCVSRR